MSKFNIYAGLGGGFGGAQFIDTIEATSSIEADEIAYLHAVDEYENYLGLYGLRTIEQIMEEDDIEDVYEAEEVYLEEMENWITYWSEPVEEE